MWEFWLADFLNELGTTIWTMWRFVTTLSTKESGHGSWTLGKPYGIDLRCYWEPFGETTWELGSLMRTWRERIGNKAKNRNPIHPSLEKKRTGSLMSASWTFSLVAWSFCKQFEIWSVSTNQYLKYKSHISFAHNEPAPSAQNGFLLSSSSLANHGG